MKVKQYRYLSPEASALRKRDGIPPWGVHPCEVDHFKGSTDRGAFSEQLRRAIELRDAIEAQD